MQWKQQKLFILYEDLLQYEKVLRYILHMSVTTVCSLQPTYVLSMFVCMYLQIVKCVCVFFMEKNTQVHVFFLPKQNILLSYILNTMGKNGKSAAMKKLQFRLNNYYCLLKSFFLHLSLSRTIAHSSPKLQLFWILAHYD